MCLRGSIRGSKRGRGPRLLRCTRRASTTSMARLVRGPDRGLRRRADDRRLRVVPRVLRGRGARARDRSATASWATPRRAALLERLETGRAARGGVRAARSRRVLEVASERLIDRLFGGMEPDEAMVDGRAARRAAPACAPRCCRTPGARTATTARSSSELFDAWVISGEVGLRKPDPAIYELAAERLGLPRRARACSSTTCPATSSRRARSAWPRSCTAATPRATLAEVSASTRLGVSPALIATTPASVSTTPTSCERATRSAQHDAGEHDRDRGVQRADHRDDAEQPLLGGEREQRRGREVERADHQQRRGVAQAARASPGAAASATAPSSATSPTRTSSSDHGAPPCSVARVDQHEEACRSRARRAARGRARRAPRGSARRPPGSRAASTMPTIASTIPATWIAPGRSPVGDADEHRDGGAGGRDRRDDAHRPDRQPAVEGRQRRAARHAGAGRQRRRPEVGERVARGGHERDRRAPPRRPARPAAP